MCRGKNLSNTVMHATAHGNHQHQHKSRSHSKVIIIIIIILIIIILQHYNAVLLHKDADTPGAYSFLPIALRHMVQWTRRRTTSFKSLAVELPTLPATMVKSHSSFSDLPCWFKDLIQHFSQRRLLCTTTRTSDLFQTSISFLSLFLTPGIFTLRGI